MYWEGQRDTEMNDKENKHLDEFVFMVLQDLPFQIRKP